jgi:hypothetical protein
VTTPIAIQNVLKTLSPVDPERQYAIRGATLDMLTKYIVALESNLDRCDERRSDLLTSNKAILDRAVRAEMRALAAERQLLQLRGINASLIDKVSDLVELNASPRPAGSC